MNNIDRLISVVPNERQISAQKMGFYLFMHYGMNTFADKEWSDGSFPPSTFCPTVVDTDDWCKAALSCRAKCIVFTAKHHDGFCLWQTDTTEYSIKNSPYQNGKGDIVKQLSESCKKYGLEMGLYLSPWDRNSELYGKGKPYDDYYCSQLKELLTRYGKITFVWFDGACAAGKDGKTKQNYDFKRYFDLIHSIQPDCILSNCGTDLRWIGNEAARPRVSEWSVVPFETYASEYRKSLGVDSEKGITCNADLGSRKALEGYEKLIWYPAEADVSIRRGWFWHRKENNTVKSGKKLLKIYDRTVRHNATLILNVPPSKAGVVDKRDAKALASLGSMLEREYSAQVTEGSAIFYEESEKYEYSHKFTQSTISRVEISEDITQSQRVERFSVSLLCAGKTVASHSGTTIGFLEGFELKGVGDELRITVTECRSCPKLRLRLFA